VSYSFGVLATASVIFCWGCSYSQCYIPAASYWQSHSYPVQGIAITSVLFFWGHSYSHGHVAGVLGVATVLPFGTWLQPVSFCWGLSCTTAILLGPWVHPVSYFLSALVGPLPFCWGCRYMHCHFSQGMVSPVADVLWFSKLLAFSLPLLNFFGLWR